MTNNALVNDYFEYLYALACGRQLKSYRKVLYALHSTKYYSDIPFDDNRIEDGIDLRYRFGSENHIPLPQIASELDTEPCSILEVMVALAIRCEETIMTDPEYGDRTSRWFWEMLQSLGLSIMSDDKFNKTRAMHVIQNFLDHNYAKNGKGGLFTICDDDYDMTKAELWCQMWRYLDNVIENSKGENE